MPFEPNKQQWQQVKAVLTQVLRAPAEARSAMINEAVSDDAPLRNYVLDVVRSYERSTRRFDLPPLPDTVLEGTTGPPQLNLKAGDIVGPYHVVRRLAAGGMGVVFLAEDQRLGRRVALKVVSASPGTGPDMNRRLMNESRSAALLNHPGIVTLHDVIETGGGLVAVMEFVEGRPLSELIVDGPLPLGFALLLARQLAEALSYAHGRGIVHCDLKPANIQVLPSGAPKILDFGLARIIDPLASADRIDGPIFGTPGYMAPERLLGREPTAAADVYALGVILYELLTATSPFPIDDSGQHFLETVTATPPRPSTIVVGIPPAIDDLVLHCLAKSPRERLQPHEMIRILNEALFVLDAASHSVPLSVGGARSEPIDNSTQAWPRTYRLAALAVGAIAVVTFLGFITSISYNQPIGLTGAFASETAAVWPLWGLRSLVAVIGGTTILTLGFIAIRGAGRLALATIAPLQRSSTTAFARLERKTASMRSARNSVLASALLLTQLFALGMYMWRFQDVLVGLDHFLTKPPDAQLWALGPRYRAEHGWLGQLLTLQLALFGWGWYGIVKRGAARNEHDARAMVVAGLLVMAFSLVAFQVTPFRVLYHNQGERVSFDSKPCYLLGQRSEDALLFCPSQPPPWTRVIKSGDPALRRDGAFESIFSAVSR